MGVVAKQRIGTLEFFMSWSLEFRNRSIEKIGNKQESNLPELDVHNFFLVFIRWINSSL